MAGYYPRLPILCVVAPRFSPSRITFKSRQVTRLFSAKLRSRARAG